MKKNGYYEWYLTRYCFACPYNIMDDSKKYPCSSQSCLCKRKDSFEEYKGRLTARSAKLTDSGE